MIETSENITPAKWYVSKIICGLVMFLLPLILYMIARIMRFIPDENSWWAQGMNHGPWRWELPGLIVMCCQLILLGGAPVITVWGLTRGVRKKDWKPALGGISIGISYIMLLYVQLNILYWTLD